MARPFDGSVLVRLQRELRAGIQAGAALAAAAGCGGSVDAPLDTGTQQPADTAPQQQTSEHSEDVANPNAPSQLDPLPAELLGCFGPNNDGPSPGFHGQCCFSQRCYEPGPGEACAAGTLQAVHGAARGLLPAGSGSCSCTVPDVPLGTVEGPFAVNPAAITSDPRTDGAEGSCCYIVAAIGCDGRPFVVSGAQRVAKIVQRNDWGLFA